jgi:hypothetical protein
MPDLTVRIDTGEARRLANLASAIPSVVQLVLRDALKKLMTKIEGATPVGIKYKKKPASVKRMRGVSQGRWVVSGDLKKSWLGELGPTSIEVTAKVKKSKYPWVLELGKYRGIGKLKYGLGPGGVIQVSPRTAQGKGGGIYSSRATSGILGPIAEDDKLIGSITQSIIDQLRKNVE